MIAFSNDTKLSDFFDEIFILNVDKRPELVSAQLQLSDKPIVLKVGNGSSPDYFHTDTDAPPAWKGTRQSWNYFHCWWKIIDLAKERNLRNFLFLEDDAVFLPAFDQVFSVGIRSLKDWDMFYLGGNHEEEYILGRPPKHVANNLLQCTTTLDCHAVAVAASMYEPILSLKEYAHLYTNPFFDGLIAYKYHRERKVYCLDPSVVVQRDGFSFNENRFIQKGRRG